MLMRLTRLLPVVVASLALNFLNGDPLFPICLVALALLATLIGPRVALDKATERLTMVVVVLLVIAAVRATMPVGRASGVAAIPLGVSVACLVVAALRLLLARPEGGARFGRLLSLIAIFAIGAAKPGLAYALVTLLHLATLFLEQRVGDSARPKLGALGRGTVIAGVATLGLALCLAVVGAATLRVGHAYVERRFQLAVSAYYDEESGLSDYVRLGQMRKLLLSNDVVLRVTGTVDHLRGVVLDDYDGTWGRGAAGGYQRTELGRAVSDVGKRIEIRRADLDDRRVVLPLGAVSLRYEGTHLERDAFLAYVDGGGGALYSFGISSEPPNELGPPSSRDVAVPTRIRPSLEHIAATFVGDDKEPKHALSKIEQHLLRDYRYSLSHESTPRVDPIVDFLLVHKSGHCEYFASAFVLLARSVGVPARLVLGYRVAERNPYFDHWVVRKKHAHAWAEAFVDGRWTTVDPTPMSELPDDVSHDEKGLVALREALSMGLARARTWLSERTIYELSGAAVLGLLVFGLQRWARERREKGRAPPSHLAYREPDPRFLALEKRLTERGIARAVGETLEDFAARQPDEAVRHALSLYAKGRYSGNPDDIDAAFAPSKE